MTSTNAKPDVVFIVGMGRSGTSLACQVLEAAGGYFGAKEDLIPPDAKNAKGYYEHLPMQVINIALLRDLFGVTWLFNGALPAGWHEWEQLDIFAAQAVPVFKKELDAAKSIGVPFCFKDSRVTVLSPFWERVAREAGAESFEYILCWRHPAEVYLSLFPREPVARGELEMPQTVQHFHQANHPWVHRDDIFETWAYYMTCGMELNPAAMIRFDGWFNGEAGKLANTLTDVADLDRLPPAQLRKIIEPGIRHFKFME